MPNLLGQWHHFRARTLEVPFKGEQTTVREPARKPHWTLLDVTTRTTMSTYTQHSVTGFIICHWGGPGVGCRVGTASPWPHLPGAFTLGTVCSTLQLTLSLVSFCLYLLAGTEYLKRVQKNTNHSAVTKIFDDFWKLFTSLKRNPELHTSMLKLCLRIRQMLMSESFQ